MLETHNAPARDRGAAAFVSADDPQHSAVGATAEELAAIERAAAGDAAWFRRRPGRAHRIRRLVDGELPGSVFPAGFTRYVVVKQLRPGCRMKLALWATRQPCGCESCAAALWQRLAVPRVRELAVEAAAVMLRAGR